MSGALLVVAPAACGGSQPAPTHTNEPMQEQIETNEPPEDIANEPAEEQAPPPSEGVEPS